MDDVGEQDEGPVVLIVEDEPSISRVLGFWLKAAGVIDYKAGSAEEALELLPLVEPDLVIADVRLPGIDGVQFIDRVKARRDVPAFLMSGHPEPSFHHADRFFSKPYDLEAMIEVIEEAVRTWHAAGESPSLTTT